MKNESQQRQSSGLRNQSRKDYKIFFPQSKNFKKEKFQRSSDYLVTSMTFLVST